MKFLWLLLLATNAQANSWYVNNPSFGDLHWKAPVASVSMLGTTGNLTGDARVSEDTFNIYVWNSTAWVEVTGGGGGSGNVTGPNSSINSDIVTFNGSNGQIIQDSGANLNASQFTIPSLDFQMGTTDAFGNPQLTYSELNSKLYLGSWSADNNTNGDSASQGMVVYGPAITSGLLNPANGGYARIKSDRFGLFTQDSTSGLDDYYWRVDETHMFFNNDSDSSTFDVERLTGQTTVGSLIDVGLTASTAVISDSNKNVVSSTTTATELGYVHGVTSSIQTQINSKQASGNYITALTGDVSASGPGSVSSVVSSVGGASATHVGYTSNVTSDVQQQINLKKIFALNGDATAWAPALAIAGYASSMNLDISGGSPIATNNGCTLGTNRINCLGGSNNYVTYTGAGNANFGRIGTIKFNYIPNYTGTPAANRNIFAITEGPFAGQNLIYLRHNGSGGAIFIEMVDNQDNLQITTNLCTFSPTAGTSYAFELDVNTTGAGTLLKINGVQCGSTQSNTFVRDDNVGIIMLMGNPFGSNNSDGAISGLDIEAPQYASSYLTVSSAGGGSGAFAAGITTVSSLAINSTTAFHNTPEINFQADTGAITSISAPLVLAAGLTHRAVNIENLEAYAKTFTCGTNPVVSFYDCASDPTCAAPVDMADVTLTATGSITDGTVSTAALAATHYWQIVLSAGVCTALNLTATAQGVMQ